MNKFRNNILNEFVYIVFCIVSLVVYISLGNIIGYVICSLALIICVYFFKGYVDLKLPISLFNYFYTFFVIVGFLVESLIRGFEFKSGTMVLFSFVFFNFFIAFRSYDRDVVELEIKNKKLINKACYFFCFLAILMSAVYFKKLGSIPLFSAELPEDRINAMTGMGYMLQPMRFGPIAALVLYLTLNEKKKRLGLFLFLITNVCLLGTGFRGTFFQNILLFIMVKSLIEKKQINVVKSLYIGVVLISFVIIIGMFRGDGTVINSLILKVAHAISVSNYILNIVVNNIFDYKYGITFFYKFTSILPIENIEYTQWLTKQLPIDFAGGVTPTVVGDMYINFGGYYWVGMIFLGLISLHLEKIAIRNDCNKILIFFIANLSLGIARSVTGGISNTLFQTFLSGALILVFFLISKLK